MAVIDMDEFRKKQLLPKDDSGYDGMVCVHCGEAWFILGGEGAAVCLDEEGCITGYAGYLYCSACGRPHQG